MNRKFATPGIEHMLEVGEAAADITPAPGTVLAGFHYTPESKRSVSGMRMPTHARALFLKRGDAGVVLLSVEVIGVSRPFSVKAQQAIGDALDLPEENVFICATHTHSAPSLIPLLQWGEVSETYAKTVLDACVRAAVAARADATESDLYYGAERVSGGNSNRTRKPWKTDEAFDAEASPVDRWLDTLLQVIYFQRGDGKRNLAWYHFSAHPVCYQDTLSGPDWPGLVAQKLEQADGIIPAYLQGHIGDVNPGDGSKWIGDAEATAMAVGLALHHAIGHSELVQFDAVRVEQTALQLPFDLQRFERELQEFSRAPENCHDGVWVDAGFARAWYEGMRGWDMRRGALPVQVRALRLGPVCLLFHPAELYSYYGLKIRSASPFSKTFAVSLCGDEIGYLTDPSAFESQEYAAVVVPKVLQYPPFKPEATDEFTAGSIGLLRSMV